MGLIFGVVAINVIIGLAQEGKAEKAAEAIKAMLSSTGARAWPPRRRMGRLEKAVQGLQLRHKGRTLLPAPAKPPRSDACTRARAQPPWCATASASAWTQPTSCRETSCA